MFETETVGPCFVQKLMFVSVWWGREEACYQLLAP